MNRAPSARRSRWPFLTLIPLGLGAWAAILAGRRARQPRWVAFGVLWTVLVLVGWVWGLIDAHGPGGAIVIFSWVACVVQAFGVRRQYDALVASGSAEPADPEALEH